MSDETAAKPLDADMLNAFAEHECGQCSPLGHQAHSERRSLARTLLAESTAREKTAIDTADALPTLGNERDALRSALAEAKAEIERLRKERDDAKWAEQVVFDANRALDELTFDNQDPAIGLEQRIRKAFASRRRQQTPEEMGVCAACTSDHNEFCTRHEDN